MKYLSNEQLLKQLINHRHPLMHTFLFCAIDYYSKEVIKEEVDMGIISYKAWKGLAEDCRNIIKEHRGEFF